MEKKKFFAVKDKETLYYIDLEAITGGECKAEITGVKTISVNLDGMTVEINLNDDGYSTEYYDEHVAIFANFDDFYDELTRLTNKRLNLFKEQYDSCLDRLNRLENTCQTYNSQLERLHEMKDRKDAEDMRDFIGHNNTTADFRRDYFIIRLIRHEPCNELVDWRTTLEETEGLDSLGRDGIIALCKFIDENATRYIRGQYIVIKRTDDGASCEPVLKEWVVRYCDVKDDA